MTYASSADLARDNPFLASFGILFRPGFRLTPPESLGDKKQSAFSNFAFESVRSQDTKGICQNEWSEKTFEHASAASVP